MKREYHRWYSPSLGRDMEMLVFGHSGARVLVFPTSCGRFFDWEDRGMFGALSDYIDNGWFQFYCVDSVDTESWYAEHRSPVERARRQARYDKYLIDEVVPFSIHQNPLAFLITTGASFGGYHAMCFGLRHPEAVNRIIALSGLFDVERFTGGIVNPEIHVVNPIAFMSQEHDEDRLAAIRKQDIIFAVGEEDSLAPGNRTFSAVLWEKNVWHAFRVWSGFAHDWPVWQQMLRIYLHGHD